MSEFLFVYGTLQRHVPHSKYYLIENYSKFIGEGHFQGRLYQLNGYPGAVLSGHSDEKVYGEVYQLTDAEVVLSILDDYEECSDPFPEPHEYIRQKLAISIAGICSVNAWVYLLNQDVKGLNQIWSGRY